MSVEREIGKTGVKVRAVGLGTMPLSISGNIGEKEAKRVIWAAIDAGTNFIDTADVYCTNDTDLGHNERLIAKAIKERGVEGIIVATKGGCTRPEGRWEVNGQQKHLRMACERSLKNLGQSEIFLYQLHTPDPSVPIEDSIGELKRLQEEGKIIHIGVSNVSSEVLKRALAVTRIESVQNRLNLFEQYDLKNGFVAECAAQGLSFICYAPTGGHFTHRKLNENEALKRLAEKHQASTYQILLAWVLSVSPNTIPIPGASRVESASDSPLAVHLELDEEDLKTIGEL